MMQTSDLNHNPMHSSQLRKKRHTLPFAHPLEGQIETVYSACPKVFATLYYMKPHPQHKGAVLTITKSPAIEVSSSDIEPNCVRWAVPEFP